MDASRCCATDRHQLCPPGSSCGCSCHTMTITYAQAVLLKAAGRRLWPDEPEQRRRIADDARAADPLDGELQRAADLLGLT